MAGGFVRFAEIFGDRVFAMESTAALRRGSGTARADRCSGKNDVHSTISGPAPATPHFGFYSLHNAVYIIFCHSLQKCGGTPKTLAVGRKKQYSIRSKIYVNRLLTDAAAA